MLEPLKAPALLLLDELTTEVEGIGAVVSGVLRDFGGLVDLCRPSKSKGAGFTSSQRSSRLLWFTFFDNTALRLFPFLASLNHDHVEFSGAVDSLNPLKFYVRGR